MNEVTKSKMTRLLCRKPTDAEIAGIDQIVETLDVRENDAIITILMAFEFYKLKIGEIPVNIEKAAQAAADAAVQITTDKTQLALTQAIVDTAQEVAKVKSGRESKIELITRASFLAGLAALLIFFIAIAGKVWSGNFASNESDVEIAKIHAQRDLEVIKINADKETEIKKINTEALLKRVEWLNNLKNADVAVNILTCNFGNSFKIDIQNGRKACLAKESGAGFWMPE